MILFLDTETAGLPRNWKAPVSDVENWPRLVQVAWISTQPDGQIVGRHEHLIRPDGFRISEKATQIHGISTGHALREGVPLRPVLSALAGALAGSSLAVAHNFGFDQKIVGAEFLRLGLPDPIGKRSSCCTMRASTEHCRIPGPNGNKWPTLDELHRHLFGEGFPGAHGALADTEACMRCYFELRRIGVLARHDPPTARS